MKLAKRLPITPNTNPINPKVINFWGNNNPNSVINILRLQEIKRIKIFPK